MRSRTSQWTLQDVHIRGSLPIGHALQDFLACQHAQTALGVPTATGNFKGQVTKGCGKKCPTIVRKRTKKKCQIVKQNKKKRPKFVKQDAKIHSSNYCCLGKSNSMLSGYAATRRIPHQARPMMVACLQTWIPLRAASLVKFCLKIPTNIPKDTRATGRPRGFRHKMYGSCCLPHCLTLCVFSKVLLLVVSMPVSKAIQTLGLFPISAPVAS